MELVYQSIKIAYEVSGTRGSEQHLQNCHFQNTIEDPSIKHPRTLDIGRVVSVCGV
jgi:hypothetical protein